jgi:hypothetical protein
VRTGPISVVTNQFGRGSDFPEPSGFLAEVVYPGDRIVCELYILAFSGLPARTRDGRLMNIARGIEVGREIPLNSLSKSFLTSFRCRAIRI